MQGRDPLQKSMVISLLGLLLSLLIIAIIGNLMTDRIPKIEYSEMRAASEKMQKVLHAFHRTASNQINRPTGELNPATKGFIGVEFSPITTTLGNLEAKQSALNPDFAALIVTWLKQCGVQEHDRVAIQASASFPALTFSAIIACETLQLEPIISVSLGASSYGANIPEFTYLDMEKLVLDFGYVSHASTLVTPGGTDDNGSSMWPGAMEILNQSVQRSGKSLFIPHTLQESAEKKRDFFNDGGEVGVFINIGGNHASLGRGNCALRIPSGLLMEPVHCRQKEADAGLIQRFNRVGIPVIHLLNIRDLAIRNGLSYKPDRTAAAGEAGIYFSKKKPMWLYTVSLLIFMLWGVLTKN